jgi:hypothetical protein
MMKISATQIDLMIKNIIRMFQPWKWFSFNQPKEIAPKVNKPSQLTLIKNHLEEYGSITTLYALDNKLHRLKKEIYKLRQMGYDIKTQILFVNGQRQIKYTLISTPLMKHELGI